MSKLAALAGAIAAAAAYTCLLGDCAALAYYWIGQSAFSFHCAIAFHDGVKVFPFLDRPR